MPKDNAPSSAEFYQEAYTQGSTTICPSAEALASLISTKFSQSENDFSTYVDVLRAAGLRAGDAILDFGCSWGYGSWQLRDAGFNVYSYELSKPRALYAREKLACNTLESLEELPERVKCVFSAHVIEHLPDPNLIWKLGSGLEDGGLIACFCPNGDPALEAAYGSSRYHRLWGKVHPLLVSPDFLQRRSEAWGYRARVYRSPYDLSSISAGALDPNIQGHELCLLAVNDPSALNTVA